MNWDAAIAGWVGGLLAVLLWGLVAAWIAVGFPFMVAIVATVIGLGLLTGMVNR